MVYLFPSRCQVSLQATLPTWLALHWVAAIWGTWLAVTLVCQVSSQPSHSQFCPGTLATTLLP